MNSILTRTTWIVLCLTSVCLPVMKAGSAPGTAPPAMHPYYKPPTISPAMQKLRDPKYWAEQQKESDAVINTTWIKQPWTGNDAPYAAARAQIERASRTMPSQAMVARYAGPANLHPNDPLAQFSRAYAVYKAMFSADFPSQDAEDIRSASEVALDEAPFPRTYNAARLRFLVILQEPFVKGDHLMQNLAYRLLQKDPNDDAVVLGLIDLDSRNSDKAAQQEGYSLIQKLIKKYPEKPQGYDTLGTWHYAQYLTYHNPSDYRSAMANYRKALNMYPVTAPRRSSLPQIMSFLTMRYHQITTHEFPSDELPPQSLIRGRRNRVSGI